MIEYEYTDSDNNSPRKIEPGEYEVKVVGFEFGLSPSGTEKLTLNLEFQDIGVKFKDDVYFTPAAAWRMDTVLKCFAASLKVDLPKVGERVSINDDFVNSRLMNGEGRVLVKERMYKEKKQTDITYLAGVTLKPTGAGEGQSTMIAEEEGNADVPF